MSVAFNQDLDVVLGKSTYARRRVLVESASPIRLSIYSRLYTMCNYGYFGSISIEYVYLNTVHELIELGAKQIRNEIAVLLSNLGNRIIYFG